MRVSLFFDRQVIAISTQAELDSQAPKLRCEQGISPVSFYKCCAKLGAMDASLMALQGDMSMHAVRAGWASVACYRYLLRLP